MALGESDNAIVTVVIRQRSHILHVSSIPNDDHGDDDGGGAHARRK